jgi:tetratricopeptide (TPR) repeat protein
VWREQEKFEKQYQRNVKAKKLLSEGKIDEAIKLYEQNIKEECDGNHPYDQLANIYRKQNKIEDEIRVLEQAIYVFTNVVHKARADRLRKLERFKERLAEAKKLLKSEQ